MGVGEVEFGFVREMCTAVRVRLVCHLCWSLVGWLGAGLVGWLVDEVHVLRRDTWVRFGTRLRLKVSQ
jgi:hypothetical protein